MRKMIFGIVIGIILGSGIVYAASYYAKDVSYQPSDASWEVNNVNEAINSLYNSVNNELSTTKIIKYENVLDNFTITPSNSNASGSNIEPVNIGEDNFYNLTGSVNYAQNVSFSINKDLSNYKFLKLYIEYWTINGANYEHNVDLTIGDETLSFKLIPSGQTVKTKNLVVGINNPENKTISAKIATTVNVPNSMKFNIGISLGK